MWRARGRWRGSPGELCSGKLRLQGRLSLEEVLPVRAAGGAGGGRAVGDGRDVGGQGGRGARAGREGGEGAEPGAVRGDVFGEQVRERRGAAREGRQRVQAREEVYVGASGASEGAWGGRRWLPGRISVPCASDRVLTPVAGLRPPALPRLPPNPLPSLPASPHLDPGSPSERSLGRQR